MSKHFWIRNPKTKTEGYCVNSYGALSKLTLKKYESVWLTCEEVLKIKKSKTKKEKYYKCEKIFKNKSPQSKGKQKELSKEEQSKLEKLFS